MFSRAWYRLLSFPRFSALDAVVVVAIFFEFDCLTGSLSLSDSSYVLWISCRGMGFTAIIRKLQNNSITEDVVFK